MGIQWILFFVFMGNNFSELRKNGILEDLSYPFCGFAKVLPWILLLSITI